VIQRVKQSRLTHPTSVDATLGLRYYCDARGCTRRVHTSLLESSGSRARPLETRTVLADIDPGSLIAGQIENALCSEVVVQINQRRGTRAETPHLRSFLGSYRPAKDSAKHPRKKSCLRHIWFR